MTDQIFLKKQILLTLESAADWRERKAIEHPDDERNAEAAREIRALYREIEKIPPTDPMLNTLQEEFNKGADLHAFSEKESELIRDIGFRRSFMSGRSYLGGLIDMALSTIEPK